MRKQLEHIRDSMEKSETDLQEKRQMAMLEKQKTANKFFEEALAKEEKEKQRKRKKKNRSKVFKLAQTFSGKSPKSPDKSMD